MSGDSRRDADRALRPGLDRLLRSRSVAVVGATPRQGPARTLIANALATGGQAWGVHPTRSEAAGLRCWPTCAELPAAPDVAVLLVGPERIEAAASDAIAAGAGALVLPGLGSDGGRHGAATAARIGRRADAAGIPVVGHNCMGIVVPDALPAWIGTLGRELRRGRVAAVVQSGSVGEALCALGPRIGFRCIVSVGAELTHDVADWCAELATDAETEAVGLFLETVRRPAALRAALELLGEAGKPVACLRVGKSAAGARATIAHSDAVLTPARSFAALARAVGLIEVEDFAELVETLELLGHPRRPTGPRIAAVTISGGEAALLGDLAEGAGAPLADFSPALRAQIAAVLPEQMAVQNPLDAWTVGDTFAVYRRVFEAIAASREYDALAVQLDQSPFVGEFEQDVAEAIVGELVAATRGTAIAPVLLSMQSSEPGDRLPALAAAAEVPLLRGSAAAVRALVGAARCPPPQRLAPPQDPPRRLSVPPGGIGELEAAELLRANGIRFAEHRGAAGAEAAVAAARELGFPVVVKADVRGHRSAASQVALGLASEAEVRAAAARIGGSLIVARQVPPAPELYCGGTAEGGYGPTVCVGWGGRDVERGRFVACALAPIDSAAARSLIEDVPGVREACGEGMLDELCATLAAISEIVATLPAGASLDVNPILLSKQHGPIAVDVLVAVAEEVDSTA